VHLAGPVAALCSLGDYIAPIRPVSLKFVDANVDREKDAHHRQATGDAEIGERDEDVLAGQRGRALSGTRLVTQSDIAIARSGSTDRISAWACGDRGIAACSVPSASPNRRQNERGLSGGQHP